MEIRIDIDLETLKRNARRHLASRKVRVVAACALALGPVLVYAASKPNTFSSGATISASQVNANFDTAISALNAAESSLSAKGTPGSVYTRWGRSSCPSGATLLYDGYVGGKSYDHSGSGANTLCLQKTPTWDSYGDGNHNGGLIYGLEFETSGYGIGSLSSGYQNYETPCAVCTVPRDASFMLPGRNSCPSGWTTEYQGYLMSTFYQQYQSEFVCVDRDPETRGSNSNSNGDLWYPVEAECGSLPCGPYVHDRELTCSVCTR